MTRLQLLTRYTSDVWKEPSGTLQCCRNQTYLHSVDEPSLIGYEASLRFELSVPGTGHLCQVFGEPFLCTDGTEQQGVHRTVVLEKCGGCVRDDRRLQQRQVGSFLFSHWRIFFQIRKLVAHYRQRIREEKGPAWTEEDEEELRKLYEEHRHSEGLFFLLSLI